MPDREATIPRMAGYGPTPIRRGTVDPSAPRGSGDHPYDIGYNFERATELWLERRGWWVKRSHGSKGIMDFIAIRKDSPTLFIQAKLTATIHSPEWNRLLDLSTSLGVWPVVAFRSGERSISFMRLDDRREPRKHGRPWTEVDVRTLQESLAFAA